MNIRKDPLVNEQYYHIFSRSIAKYTIFGDQEDFTRFLEIMRLYRYSNFNYKYSKFTVLNPKMQAEIIDNLDAKNDVFVEIVAYCLMPTHLHLVLKQKSENGISKYMAKILNSYTRYFNSKHHRIGPLWEGHFKNVLVKSDEQLLHLTRYVHLNPTSAALVNRPEDWEFSSYSAYTGRDKMLKQEQPCCFDKIINLSPKQYIKFANDQKSYQRDLSLIKSILMDNYTG